MPKTLEEKKEAARIASKKWRKSNPDKVKEYNRLYREKKKAEKLQRESS